MDRVTRLTIDDAGLPGGAERSREPRAQSAFAYKNLRHGLLHGVHERECERDVARPQLFDLLRLRTRAGNGPIVKKSVRELHGHPVRCAPTLLREHAEILRRRPRERMAQHRALRHGRVSSSTWSLYRDGVGIVNGWTADTGTTPIGRIQLGDNAAKTWTINFDNVRLDQAAG